MRAGRSWQVPEETVYAYIGTVKPKVGNEAILSCSVGNTSYMDMVKNSYYVDKTLLIRDLIDDQVPVILFTRPRRFGKTLALDMLKTFFEKTKEDTSVYFKDKQIWAFGILTGILRVSKENLFALMQGETVQASLNMDVIYPRITDGTDTIFSFLLIAGYLRPVSDAVETEFGTFIELELPNKEIRRVYNTEILSWLRGNVDGNIIHARHYYGI